MTTEEPSRRAEQRRPGNQTRRDRKGDEIGTREGWDSQRNSDRHIITLRVAMVRVNAWKEQTTRNQAIARHNNYFPPREFAPPHHTQHYSQLRIEPLVLTRNAQ